METKTVSNSEGCAEIVAPETSSTFEIKNRWIANATGLTTDLVRTVRTHRGKPNGYTWNIRNAIQSFRKQLKQVPPSFIENLTPIEERMRKKYMDAHKGDLVSVELECVFYRASMIPKREALSKFLVDIDGDGSLRYHPEGDDDERDPETEEVVRHGTAEVKLTFRPERLHKLKKVLEVLRESGAEVNTTCGTHIHLDQRDVKRRQADVRAKRLIKALPALVQLVAPSRLDNQYCRPNSPIIDGETYTHGRGRYYAINFYDAYAKHKTIEVRMHGGTLDVWKIIGWVNLCKFITLSADIDRIAERNMAHACRQNSNGCASYSSRKLQISLEDLITLPTLPHELRMYAWRRFRQFHPAEAENLRNKLFEEEKYNLTDGMAIG